MILRIFEKKNYLKPIKERSSGNNAGETPQTIIFIHGLSGGSLSTWGKMIAVCASDPAFDKFNLDSFDYPSVKWRVPYTTRMAKLQDLGRGLRTYVETNHSDSEAITLVGHSLGGLVARQYIVDELRAERQLRIKNLIMYATPNTGASLANFASNLSWKHHHLTQLCNDSDIIERLNDDWERRSIEGMLSVLYVMGAADAIVRPESALPFVGRDNYKVLMHNGHINITQADGVHDLRYKVLKQALVSDAAAHIEEAVPQYTDNEPGDPLFDIYSQKDGKYYYVRCIDSTISSIVSTRNVWLSGVSGSGKTAILRHAALEKDWQLYHISLGGIERATPYRILRSLCIEYASAKEIDDLPPTTADTSELIIFFKRIARLSSGLRRQIVLVEEIPLQIGSEYTELLRLFGNLANALSSDIGLRSIITLMFSSIDHPEQCLANDMIKLRERFAFINIDPWSQDEITGLLVLLCNHYMLDFSNVERKEIVSRAQGSPRYVKLLVRHLLRSTNGARDLSSSLDAVTRESMQYS